MNNTSLIVSLNPDDNTVDSVNISSELQQAFTSVFVTLSTNPFDIEKANGYMTTYYRDLKGAEFSVSDFNALLQKSSVVIASVVVKGKNIVQLDMDGNIMLFDQNPSFSDTKGNSKEMLGSAEKIGDNEFLIADSINKRAIIISSISHKVLWEYISDRYIVDAHMTLSDNALISIESSYVGGELRIHNNQTVIWENNTDVPLYVYSGDITNIDLDHNFNINDYGLDFKSNLLNIGDRYAHKITSTVEQSWFTYPNFMNGRIIVSNNIVSDSSQFILTESDSLDSVSSSRVIKIDVWGNIMSSFGTGYLVKPRDARPLKDGRILISV